MEQIWLNSSKKQTGLLVCLEGSSTKLHEAILRQLVLFDASQTLEHSPALVNGGKTPLHLTDKSQVTAYVPSTRFFIPIFLQGLTSGSP